MPDPTWRQIAALLIVVFGVLALFLLAGLLELAEQGKCC
jgi:hypothetical protein